MARHRPASWYACWKLRKPELRVLHADGYIFATPENLAAMAGMMKDFFDRTYYVALDRINGGHMRLWCALSVTVIGPR
jgi:multimeric flavodoxin WrbA